MTDLELLDLIHTKSPDELSVEEIELLRKGIAASPELRREVAERVEMEQYLHHALGRVNLSVDDIITRADQRTAGPASVMSQLGLVACALVGCAIGAAVILAIVSPRRPHEPSVAEVLTDANSNDTNPPKTEKTPSAPVPTEPVSDPSPSDRLIEDAAVPSGIDGTSTAIAQAPPPETPTAKPAAEPWDLDVAAAEALPKSALDLFAPVPADAPPPQADDLKKWFANVDGQRGEFAVRDINGSRWGNMEGLLRLRAPLKPNTALNFALWDYNNLRIHCWSGKSGVTIDYFELPSKPWVAYATTRKGSEPVPTGFVLAATDDGRYWRTYPHQPAPLQLRHQNGLLTLSRGDVRLLDVPMSVAPTEIYWEGNALVRYLAMVPAAELPPVPAQRPVAAELVLAEQPWTPLAENTGVFTKHGDGSVELKTEKNKQPVVTSFPVPSTGVQELIFEIESPQPGTGVCLVDAEGKPTYLASFMREGADRMQVGLPTPGDVHLEAQGDINNHPMGYVGSHTWLKLVIASGWLKLSTSIDGEHWAHAVDPRANADQGFAGVGLYITQHESARAIRLRKVTLRDFEALNSLAPPELRASANGLATEQEIGKFREAALQSTPAGVKPADWLRACAIRRLASGAKETLGDDLLQLLWQDSMKTKLSLETRLRLLDDILTLAPTWSNAAQSERQVRYYEELGKTLSSLDKPGAYSQIARRQMIAPVRSHNVFEYLPAGLPRREALDLALNRQWDELDAFTRRFNFFFFAEKLNAQEFYNWATSLVSQQQPRQTGSSAIAWKAIWRHPLSTELSKEGFNVLADLRVALQSDAYRDACQVIGSATSSGMLGLLPDTNDPDLSVSLPATVALAMREYPQFRTTMNEEFGPLGRLRVRQAIASGDADVVEAATLQFYGTEAAAEAHVWLADRALSAGAFAAARGHYRAARDTAPKELLNRLAAGEQLAAALMGRDAGQTIRGAVDFGDTRISVTELQKLTTEIRTSRAAESALEQAAAASKDLRLPPLGNYDVAKRSRLEGETGQSPQNVPGEYQQAGPDWPAKSLDWAARQLSTLVVENRLLVSNRFQLASYDLADGKLQWRAGLGGDQCQTHDWPLAPARPLATPSLVFVRRFRGSGPVLSCIDITNGQQKWETRLEGERWVISDPALVSGTLYTCTVQHTDVGYTLSLGAFDPQTGVLLRERPLVSLRENWWRVRDCQMQVADETFIIVTAGAVLRCDLMGNLRWARQQLWIPPDVDRFWMFQAQSLSLLEGARLFVAQPCVPAVVALDSDNGRLLWKANLTTARRLLGAVGNQLLIETSDGIRAVDAATGRRLWQFDSDTLLDGYAISPTNGLLVSYREPVEKENDRMVTLAWLDVATGKPRHTASFPQLKHDTPFFGPLIIRGNHIWSFFTGGMQDPNRDLVEIFPK